MKINISIRLIYFILLIQIYTVKIMLTQLNTWEIIYIKFSNVLNKGQLHIKYENHIKIIIYL